MHTLLMIFTCGALVVALLAVLWEAFNRGKW
jgi:hypothetical protein